MLSLVRYHRESVTFGRWKGHTFWEEGSDKIQHKNIRVSRNNVRPITNGRTTDQVGATVKVQVDGQLSGITLEGTARDINGQVETVFTMRCVFVHVHLLKRCKNGTKKQAKQANETTLETPTNGTGGIVHARPWIIKLCRSLEATFTDRWCGKGDIIENKHVLTLIEMSNYFA